MKAFYCEKCNHIKYTEDNQVTCMFCNGEMQNFGFKDTDIVRINIADLLFNAVIFPDIDIYNLINKKKYSQEFKEYPEFNKVYSYINKDISFKEYIIRLNNCLDEYVSIVLKEKSSEYEINYKNIEKSIEDSIENISELLKRYSNPIKFNKIHKKNYVYKVERKNGANYDLALILADNLKKLVKKIDSFVKTNFLFGSNFIINSEFIKPYVKEDKYREKLEKANKEIEKVLNKEYIIDFFSDGKDEIYEMSYCFWKTFSTLMFYYEYVQKEEWQFLNVAVENEMLINQLNEVVENIYKEYDDIIYSNFLFKDKNIDELNEIYNKLCCIKLPNINYGKRNKNSGASQGEAALNTLIGLRNVKESIEKIKAYTNVNKNSENLNIHMCFNGNPGTGKTEVARIIAQILYENKILPTNKVVEVDRSGLVGEYVGETPQKTMKAIFQAMGGVLFVDEAYALVPKDGSFDYGHEAVATLIKAMEDYRGQLCVILAGYTNEMNRLLESNPGFKSRIQFVLNFENYSRKELGEIADLMIKNRKYYYTDDAKNKILDVTDILRKKPNFANARDIRNILDQVIMCQNIRLNDPKNHIIEEEDVIKYIKDNNINVPISNFTCDDRILSGEEELENLVGLSSIKKTIKKISAFAKKNAKNNLNLHMCFYGNPGTGKTEVARIISRILYDSGVLKEAKVIETDKTGLVAEYVGQSGPKTHEKVMEAMGGVLFIDEAYALVDDDTTNSFAKEAISVLLKDMEDYRGKFCVIMAGYRNEMKKMISLNPGLESRIQFELDFPDYERDELREIAILMLKNKNYFISDEALEQILNISDYEKKQPNYANARSIRNILDQVILNQNFRTADVEGDYNIDIEDVNEYILDNNLEIECKISSNNNYVEIDSLLSLYDSFSSKIDNNYLEQSIVSISGQNGNGTGFIINNKGLCLTCAHCIQDEEALKARIIYNFGNKKIKLYSSIKLIKKDEKNDLALIQLDENNEYDFLPLTQVEYKYEPLKEFIMAGYPFGGEIYKEISITDGKIASVNYIDGRKVIFANMFGKPGNSGSPIIDKESMRVIGVFWGGISHSNEMIHCFTPIDIVINFLLSKK